MMRLPMAAFLKQNKIPVILAIIWMLLWADWSAWYWLPTWFHWIGFTAYAVGIWVWHFKWARRQNFRMEQRRWCLLPVFLLTWQWTVFASRELGWMPIAKFLAIVGLSIFFLAGLATAIWYVELGSRRYAASNSTALTSVDGHVWNLANLEAWYFRKKAQKLRPGRCRES